MLCVCIVHGACVCISALFEPPVDDAFALSTTRGGEVCILRAYFTKVSVALEIVESALAHPHCQSRSASGMLPHFEGSAVPRGRRIAPDRQLVTTHRHTQFLPTSSRQGEYFGL